MRRARQLFAPLLAATLPALAAPAAAQLAYVEGTGNIASLAMDGGRTELEMADVNGDGHLDIALVGDHGSPFINTQQHGVTLWLGDGQGGWTLVQVGDFGYGGIALGDVNGDGLMDVGYGVHHDYSSTDLGDQLIEVALGDGSGTGWTPWDDGLATSGETWGMFGTDFGDIDGDGDLDLVSNAFGASAGVHVYRNRGDGSWSQSFGFTGSNSSMDAEFADFDGDGHLDIAAAHQLGAVYRGDGAGGFTGAHGDLPSNAWLGIGTGDVDGDGKDEYSCVIGGAPRVFSWTTGDVWIDRTGNLPAGNFEATEICDMDGDGIPDLLAAGSGQLAIFWWSPGDIWRPLHVSTLPGIGPPDIEALRTGGDIDHNGRPDIALVQDEGDWLSSRNHHRVLLEASTPQALDLCVLEPTPNRVWRGGQVRFAEWTGAAPTADIGTVTIELSTVGPNGPWQPIASGLPNSGRHQLLVPAGLNSEAARLRFTVTTSTATHVELSGPLHLIDPSPASPAVTPYGCGVNPAGSLSVLAGGPSIGTSLILGLDNPLGTQGTGSLSVLLLSLGPEASWPCGLVIPGWGMAGPGAVGELLVSLLPAELPTILGGSAWAGPGNPAPFPLSLPGNPNLVGRSLFAQGALIDATGPTGIGLSEGLELFIGP